MRSVSQPTFLRRSVLISEKILIVGSTIQIRKYLGHVEIHTIIVRYIY